MKDCNAIVLSLVILLSAGVAHAQDASESAGERVTLSTACVVDDHLSVWLSLETADRMIAALEEERRVLTEKLTKGSAKLERIDAGKSVGETVERTVTGMPKRIKTTDREALAESCEQIETRLTEVTQTLKRRRMQRVQIEEWLSVYLDARAAAGP